MQLLVRMLLCFAFRSLLASGVSGFFLASCVAACLSLDFLLLTDYLPITCRLLADYLPITCRLLADYLLITC